MFPLFTAGLFFNPFKLWYDDQADPKGTAEDGGASGGANDSGETESYMHADLEARVAGETQP